MIRRTIKALEAVRVYFLLKDCEKMAKKYYGKKRDELGKSYGRDADRLFDKYKDDVKATKIVIDTLTLIEAYDKEAYEKELADFMSIIEEVEKKKCPGQCCNTEQGNETR